MKYKGFEIVIEKKGDLFWSKIRNVHGVVIQEFVAVTKKRQAKKFARDYIDKYEVQMRK